MIVASLEVQFLSKAAGCQKRRITNICLAMVVDNGCAENIFFVHLVYISVFQADLVMICFVIAL